MRTIQLGGRIGIISRVAGLLVLGVFLPGVVFAADSGDAPGQGSAKVADAAGADASAPVPATMPDPWARENATKLVNDIFHDKLAKARTPAEKVDVARKMLQTAAETGDGDPASRFVLYEKARDAAIEGMDAELAMSIVGQSAQAFRVDGVAMKLTTLAKLVEALPADGQQALLDQIRPFITEKIAEDRFDLAKQGADIAAACGRKSTNTALAAQAVGFIRVVRDAEADYAQVKKFLATLAADPKDPQANLAVGKYRCFTKGQWDCGLAMLAASNDSDLKGVAAKELAQPQAAEDQAALADAWWDLSAKQTVRFRIAMRTRAEKWYQAAVEGLKGIAKARVEKRLEMLSAEEAARLSGGAACGKTMSLDLGRGLTLSLVWIPAGKFLMGSPETEKDRDGGEGPQHEVSISRPFYLGEYVVTQEQYETLMGQNPSGTKGAKNPVDSVTWSDAVGFCKRLSAKTGKNIRLPTEAEWEYACRAGSKTRFYYGDDRDCSKLGDYAWYDKNCDAKTHSVGQKKPNAWGLYDMHGNVWQWCSDWSGSYADAKNQDPQGPNSGTVRILRGGGWVGSSATCRCADRHTCSPDGQYNSFGIRVVVEVK